MAKKKTTSRRPWSNDEVKKLKKIFRNQSTKQVAAELGRPWTAVQAKASTLGLTKTKNYLKSIRRKA